MSQDGSVYDGMWENDKLHGYGTLTGPPDDKGVCPQQYAGGYTLKTSSESK